MLFLLYSRCEKGIASESRGKVGFRCFFLLYSRCEKGIASKRRKKQDFDVFLDGYLEQIEKNTSENHKMSNSDVEKALFGGR